jgi:hypothetical protein
MPRRTEFELVRLGGSGDGGYLVPDDLTGIGHVFSPGVADSWQFELDVAQATGASVHLIEVGEVPAACPFPVDRGFLGPHTVTGHVGVNDWIRSHATSGNSEWLLQMDIEGGEYGVLQALSDDFLQRFRVMVIEFHRLDLLSVYEWWRYVFQPVLSRLSEHFIIVHAHPNNAGRNINMGCVVFPELLEVTFIRRDRVRKFSEFASLPHLLDEDNHPRANSIWLTP